tara:strand:- start:88443 stop:91703 length:3261 start_codon:yes stop_codon:yes gene_type:complete
MIKHPKIKRLSTLGIIHHQNFDYEFNSFRTDFVGDGGSGKSLISDLLQLIFVGTRAFHSPTKSTDPRLPSTMVLKTKGKGTDFGYAFLNIEVNPNEFIVVGIFLESSGASQMFIIQNGNDFSEETKLIPFNHLIGVKDFLNNDTMLPIDQLKDYIIGALGYTCASWSKITKYHKILCGDENSIIPVDVSKSSKVLNNYSKIIQAFSRESLDISKSEKLKDFLFGNEAENKFEALFKSAVEELNSDVQEFKENSNEIRMLNNKNTDLVNLLNNKNNKEKLEKEFLIVRHNFLKEDILSKTNEIKTVLNNFYKGKENISFLKTLAENKTEKITQSLNNLEDKYQDAFRCKEELRRNNNQVNSFLGWMTQLKCKKDDILKKYKSYHASKDKIDKINVLNQKLKENNVLSFFNNKSWNGNIVVELGKLIVEVEKDISRKKGLSEINDIENEKSLAYWALNLNRELTIQEESIVHKYQYDNIWVEEPSDIKRKYIPKPEELLENINVYKTVEKGFWLDLNGVKEFIEYTSNPIFNTLHKAEILEYFKKQSVTLSSDIKQLEKEESNLNKLYLIIENLENPNEYIKAWNSEENIDKIEHYDFYDLELKELNMYLSNYNNSLNIASSLTNANKAFKLIDKKRNDLNTLRTNLENKLEDYVEVLNPDALKSIENKYNYIKGEVNQNSELLESLSNTDDYFGVFQKIIQEQTKYIQPLEKLNELDNKVLSLEKEKGNISDRYTSAFEKDIELEEYQGEKLNEDSIKALEESAVKTKNEYLVVYNTIASRYMDNNYARFENTGDFLGLCEEVLPVEIFNNGETLDEDIIKKIDKRLRDINLKNQELNGRKLQKLNSIVDQVNTEVSKQLDYIRRIKQFLLSEDKVITGNHRAFLRQEINKSYPREWMQDFIEKMNEESSLGIGKNILDPLKTFSNSLESFVSLEEKMIEAFHRCGGPKGTRPNVSQLLNPKSYYDLSFTIESKYGKNAGSTSQTYSATALLCIARLSLIENEKASSKKIRPGIRFMPIDEAEGLGSNFDMLYDIAKDNGYQLLSLSISPNKVDVNSQNIYLLQNNLEVSDRVNYPPIPVFGNSNEI